MLKLFVLRLRNAFNNNGYSSGKKLKQNKDNEIETDTDTGTRAGAENNPSRSDPGRRKKLT